MDVSLLNFDEFAKLNKSLSADELRACWERVKMRRNGKDYLEQKKLIKDED